MIQSPYETDFKKAPQPETSSSFECDDTDDVECIEYKSDETQAKVQVTRRSDADPAWCNVCRPERKDTGAAKFDMLSVLLDQG